MSGIETPKCGQAFVGDPFVGLPPELETWQDAHDFCVRLEKQLAAATATAARYHKALESISRNSCCDKCREAALVAKQALAGKDEPVVSSPGSDGYWWMLDTHLPVRWELVRVSGKKNVFRVESQTEIQPPRCCAKWVKVREPEGR